MTITMTMPRTTGFLSLAMLPALAAAAAVRVALPEPQTNHLWFRALSKTANTNGVYQCGEIDAGSHIPPELFDPTNSRGLQAYVDLTVALYSYTTCASEGCPAKNVELGRCAGKKYTSLATYFPNVKWAPEALMDDVCQRKCSCNYLNQNSTVLCRDGPPCTPPQLPECKDVPENPYGPFCSLCGPKYNQDVEVYLYDCELGDNKCPGPDARTNPPTPTGTVGLVPLVGAPWVQNCTKPGRQVCYQGTAADVARVVKRDPFACKPPYEATLVPYQWYDTDPCYDSGFGELLGHDPIFTNVELWGCGDSCGHPNDGECADLQGRAQGTGTYCTGPPRRFSDGTLRNHTIITCTGNPGGESSGFPAYCPNADEYCGTGTGDPFNASQCYPI